jgi:hypothetical protein
MRHHQAYHPNIKCLYAEARSLREIVLHSLVGIGGEINEEPLPKAQAVVSANIGELVATAEYETLLDRPGGENRIFALLLQSCAAEIDAKIKPVVQKHRKIAQRVVPRGRPLRLVAENGNLL